MSSVKTQLSAPLPLTDFFPHPLQLFSPPISILYPSSLMPDVIWSQISNSFLVLSWTLMSTLMSVHYFKLPYLWGGETQVQGIACREATPPRIQRPPGPGGLSREWFRVAQGGQLPASLFGLPLQQGAGLLALSEPGFQAASLCRPLFAEASAAP